ncbi:NADP-dependent 3-hydroxy acid dehydrogenase YdfG [Desulfonauticus submarinus]|uniref:NADP-dependent 3-hydroxy acid dehydrogenase YdfG n=1 Tax=Desulfonauticus submarinus TaxID=206665 RepID=A0A1G9ZIF9_9BACT|nr:SDR family oxidoreductase [Desulfonauticus submarinus]SDN20283.1 NADP-dependent 3-hydroxy acid dehydrogenase YdfG [Desulfonauticus submarinus]
MKVVIAGATGDIGKAVAKELLHQGYNLLLLYRSEEKRQTLEQELGTFGINFFCIKNFDSQQFKKSLDDFLPTAFVNAIGDGFYNKIENITVEELDNCYESNFKVPFFISQCIFSFFKKNKKGHIVFINSISGLEGFPYGGAYCSFKFALRGLAEVMYKEGKRYNIKISSIYPGVVNTKLLEKMPFRPKIKDCLDPKDIALAVKYILELPYQVEIKDLILKNTSLHWIKVSSNRKNKE